jgi:glycyl-tRNA synthetase beta chain
LIDNLLDLYQPWLGKARKRLSPEALQSELSDFLLHRVRVNLTDVVSGRCVVDAVLSNKDALKNLPDAIVRSQVVDELVKSNEGLSLIRVATRIGNILKDDADQPVSEALFSDPEETKLWREFNAAFSGIDCPPTGSSWSEPEYLAQIRRLQSLTNSIDSFFEKVMVNDENPEKRQNRHALLRQINKHFLILADFPKLQPLIT